MSSGPPGAAEEVEMVPSVVVGYDASQQSATAVRWAAREAARTGSPLLVVHVWGFAHQRTGGAGTSWLGAQVIAGVQAVADEGVAVALEAAPDVHARGSSATAHPRR
ncbi:universal stress protein [Cellulomonas soli]